MQQLDQAWSYVRSINQMVVATGGNPGKNYFLQQGIKYLGEADAIIWDAEDKGNEFPTESVNTWLDGALDALNIANNELRK